jgi:hypothetical protein
MKIVGQIINELYTEIEKIKSNKDYVEDSENYDISDKSLSGQIEDYYFNHLKFKRKNNNNIIYKLPTKDILSLIYNNSDKDVSYSLIVNDDDIYETIVKPNECVYPLYNKNMIPLFLLNQNVYISCSNIQSLILNMTDLYEKDKKYFKSNYNYSIENNYGEYDMIKNNEYFFDKPFSKNSILFSNKLKNNIHIVI